MLKLWRFDYRQKRYRRGWHSKGNITQVGTFRIKYGTTFTFSINYLQKHTRTQDLQWRGFIGMDPGTL